MVALVTKFTASRIEYHRTNPYNSTPITMEERERQLTCLAKNIYHEAATEPFEGKVAVAQVTLNRAESGRFPSDICNVVYQKNVFMDKVICQFSWACDQVHRNRPINKGKVQTEARAYPLSDGRKAPYQATRRLHGPRPLHSNAQSRQANRGNPRESGLLGGANRCMQ